MSIVVSVALAFAAMLSAFTGEVARASSLRARAQMAADAAALAAVAESAPHGRGMHEYEARRFAEANDARLLECLCGDGATAVQVSVAVGGVVADARAVLDAEALLPASPGFDRAGLHPRLAAVVERLILEARGAVRLVSGFRSADEQRLLWSEALRRYGSSDAADDWVAPPGRSMHERGLAVDLGGDLDLAGRLVAELGLPLHRPLTNEPWHFELVGSR